MIRAALDDEAVADELYALDRKAVVATLITVLTALIHDENLDNAGLDEFLTKAWKRANRQRPVTATSTTPAPLGYQVPWLSASYLRVSPTPCSHRTGASPAD